MVYICLGCLSGTLTTTTADYYGETTAGKVTESISPLCSSKSKYFSSSSTSSSFTATTPSQPASLSVSCCCSCCKDEAELNLPYESCASCTDKSLETAVSCASNSRPTSATVTYNFEAAPTMSGSRFPNRLAYREDFQVQEKLTEDLASMPDEEKTVLGYNISDLIVDCQFEGTPCNLTR